MNKEMMKKVLAFALVIIIINCFVLRGAAIEKNSCDMNREQDYLISGCEKNYCRDNYDVIFRVDSNWEGGHNISVTITNTGNKDIENWICKLDYAAEISQIWGASLEEIEQGEIRIKNADWNRKIPVGEQDICLDEERGI